MNKSKKNKNVPNPIRIYNEYPKKKERKIKKYNNTTNIAETERIE